MSEPSREPKPQAKIKSIWLAPVVTWIAVVALLAVNASLAFAPLGRAKFAVTFVVAGVQVVLVGLYFMRLNRSSALVRLTAVAGVVWLSFLFVMAGADYLTRP